MLVELKAHDLAAQLNVCEMSINDLDEQIKALQSRKKRLADELEQFKDDLRESMVSSGIFSIESKEHNILFRLDPPVITVQIDSEDEIPSKFFRVKKEPDKTAIKKALQVGDDVPGARLVEGKHRLMIRA